MCRKMLLCECQRKEKRNPLAVFFCRLLVGRPFLPHRPTSGLLFAITFRAISCGQKKKLPYELRKVESPGGEQVRTCGSGKTGRSQPKLSKRGKEWETIRLLTDWTCTGGPALSGPGPGGASISYKARVNSFEFVPLLASRFVPKNAQPIFQHTVLGIIPYVLTTAPHIAVHSAAQSNSQIAFLDSAIL